MTQIQIFGPEAHKERWLPPQARAEVIGCPNLTDPAHGSDPAGMRTRAVKRGDCFVLNCARADFTNDSLPPVAVVRPRRSDGTLGGFFADRDTPGSPKREYEGKFSPRASGTPELVLQDRTVPGFKMTGSEDLESSLMLLNER